MNVTPSLYALSVYNNACAEILEERTALRRRMLQLIANLALELHITESIKETEVCQRCDDSGYRQVYYLNVGRVFPEPCDCKAGQEARAMKRNVRKVWENEDWPR